MPLIHRCLLAGLLLSAARVPAAPPSPGYELLFADEFQGDNVDESAWNYRTGYRGGLGMDGDNRKENVSVSGGRLHIAARVETIHGKRAFTGGGLISKHQFGYGYYESRSVPFMAGRGVHTSFWQRGGSVPNNTVFEIDSYEIDSTRHDATNNLYVILCPKPFTELPWPHRAHIPWQFQADGTFVDAYEYTPEGVVFYDNGRIVAKADFDNLAAQQAVWLTALNGCGKVDESKQPGESTFDYFRYYAKDYPGVNLLPNGSFEYNQDRIDPEKPVCWQMDGTTAAGRVSSGNAARDRYFFRIASGNTPQDLTGRQTLEFIRNGAYQLSAMVRSSGGQQVARLVVRDYGSGEMSLDIPPSTIWKRITLPDIPVSNHGATIAFEVKGKPGNWLELDDIRFLKPSQPGTAVPEPRPFILAGDPIWSLATKEPIDFNGDSKFYFFDRNVGCGKAVTVCFTLKVPSLGRMCPISRTPATGNDGWSVWLNDSGDLTFRIGSANNFHSVVAAHAIKAGVEQQVTCVFDRGTARLYVGGILLKTDTGIPQGTSDTTKPGKLGNVNEKFEAIGDVGVILDGKPETKTRLPAKPFVGSLGSVHIHNRALSEGEIIGKG